MDSKFSLNNYDTTTDSNLIYIGRENEIGSWRISKINLSTGEKSYATLNNNQSYQSYSQAWQARTSLQYDSYKDSF